VFPRSTDEVQAIRDRYARREQIPASRYHPLNPYEFCARQERERALIRCLKRAGQVPVQDKRVLEVGCGGGMNLLDLIRLGFQPQNLVGNDLLEERLARARMVLPPALALIPGDASSLALEEESFDIVLQSMVFTSILDKSFQEKLASRMWAWARPGGGILWIDFIWDNPKNPDVRGVPVKRIRQLFPGGRMLRWSVTLAPPIGRRLCKILPALYPVFNAIPLLRTHVLCWIQKPRTGSTLGLDGTKDKPWCEDA